MIKAIIIEDEFKAAELLSSMLTEIEPDIVIIDKCEDLPTAVKSIKRNMPDIVFLDVELPVFKGLQLLDFLNPEDITFKIIFTTASDEYALRAFEMSAIDYILKPLQYDKLKSAINKYVESRKPSNADHFATLKDNFSDKGIKKIVIPQNNGFEIVKLEDIMLIKAEGSYSKIVMDNEKVIIASHNLKYFEDMFRDESYFIRIHRSHLVNVHFAKRILRNNGSLLVLENETQLPISPEKLDSVLRFFNFNKK